MGGHALLSAGEGEALPPEPWGGAEACTHRVLPESGGGALLMVSAGEVRVHVLLPESGGGALLPEREDKAGVHALLLAGEGEARAEGGERGLEGGVRKGGRDEREQWRRRGKQRWRRWLHRGRERERESVVDSVGRSFIRKEEANLPTHGSSAPPGPQFVGVRLGAREHSPPDRGYNCTGVE